MKDWKPEADNYRLFRDGTWDGEDLETKALLNTRIRQVFQEALDSTLSAEEWAEKPWVFPDDAIQ